MGKKRLACTGAYTGCAYPMFIQLSHQITA
jgi:hypothetical protein